MFDNISFQIENFNNKDFNLFLENCNLEKPKSGNWMQFDWQNLRVNYFPKQSLIKVSNSLHKFYNAQIEGIGDVNHNDFTFTQVEETVNYLQTAFGRNSNEMKLYGRFEYGFNINTGSLKPYDIIDRYQSIVTTATNPFNVFYNKHGKPYSKFCSFTTYSIKCYDKGKQMGLVGTNIMRYEVVHNSSIKTREVFQKTNITLKDLTVKETWEKCYAFILKSYNSIRILAFPNDGIDLYTKTMCYSLATVNKDYKKSIKEILPQLKIAHDSLKQKTDSPHALVSKGLTKKYDSLMAA